MGAVAHAARSDVFRAKIILARLRKRYRELFRQEIADTVADSAEVEPELRFLAAVLSKK